MSKRQNHTQSNFLSVVLSICLTGLSAAPMPVVYQTPPSIPKLFHDATYQIGWDINMSPYAGGEDLLFALRSIERIQGYLFAGNPITTSTTTQAKIWRLGELITCWLPLNYLAIVIDHEIFGHGYRIRDIGSAKAHVEGYHIGVPIPYGPGGGATSYTIKKAYTSSDATATSMAGVESTAILAQLTKLKWLESKKVDPRQVALYLFGQYDLPLYIGDLTVRNDHELQGHDINEYIKTLNLTYTQGHLHVGTLYSLSLINLADAFTYYSLYSWARYIVSGHEGPIPMIPLRDYGWLPGARMGLTPFGPEYFLENYLLKGRTPYYFYLKGGNHADNRYVGLGFFAPTIWSHQQWKIGARFDAWIQPQYLAMPGAIPLLKVKPTELTAPLYSLSKQAKMVSGASGSFIVTYEFRGRSGFELEFGWKSKGFLPGNALDQSPIARAYYTLLF